MARGLTFLIIATWLSIGWAGTQDYQYPLKDPYQATIVGTPEEYQPALPEKIPLKKRSMKVFEDREIPDVFWYSEQLRYSYALQKKAAPFVFLIPGTGGSSSSSDLLLMARAFYQEGFHIATVSSPTHENFIVNASSTAVPGDAVGDAEDLYRVMERIWDSLKSDVEVTDFYVAGYSLGGYNTGFVAWLDEQRQVFKFKKALMINPPLSLYNSISLLDRMLQNIPGGEDNFALFYERLVEGLTQVYKQADTVEFNEEILYQAFHALQLKDEELAALIGVAFRLMASNMAFTSDVMTNFGYIKPKNMRLRPNTSLTRLQNVADRLGFTDYYHEYFYPYHKQKDPSLDREELVDRMSLAAIEDYLRSSDTVEVVHNEDDLILAKGEIDFFRRVFGDRAKIYPFGGHMGNIGYRDNVAHMIDVFGRPRDRRVNK